MSDKEETTFENKCNILAELWVDYRDSHDLQEYVSYNDLGLPLSFLVSEALVTPTPRAKDMIVESFDLLLSTLEVEDVGFTTLEELMLG